MKTKFMDLHFLANCSKPTRVIKQGLYSAPDYKDIKNTNSGSVHVTHFRPARSIDHAVVAARHTAEPHHTFHLAPSQLVNRGSSAIRFSRHHGNTDDME